MERSQEQTTEACNASRVAVVDKLEEVRVKGTVPPCLCFFGSDIVNFRVRCVHVRSL